MKIVSLLIVFFYYSIIQAADYTIPPSSYSLCSGDLDNDGDNDIVVGHNSEHGIISFLYNNGMGEFILEDTLHFFGGLRVYEIVNLDENPIPDLIVHHQNGIGGTQHFAVFYNNDIYNPFFYDSGISGYGISYHDTGDLDNDGDLDLVFDFSNAPFWCAFYNLGDQEFSEPEFYELPGHVIKCEDLDGDNRADVVTQGAETNIHYSTGNGFETELLCLDVVNGTMVLEDMDNDGDFDIVLSQLFQPRNYFRIYENLGNREYMLHDQNIQGSYTEALSADINGDQLIDIINVISGDYFYVYFNEGNFVLSECTWIYFGNIGEYSQEGNFNDFDGNGTQDIAIARYFIGEPNILTVLFNDGTGVFYEEPVNIIDNEIFKYDPYHVSCYPTPFEDNTTISFKLPYAKKCNFKIYNLKGQLVNTLIPDNLIRKGKHIFYWNGKDIYGNDISSGVYLYKLSIDNEVISKKVLKLKN